ncbi:hypothetical protein RCL1_006516 [Eukaryota sp. TZLM3-RCL]
MPRYPKRSSRKHPTKIEEHPIHQDEEVSSHRFKTFTPGQFLPYPNASNLRRCPAGQVCHFDLDSQEVKLGPNELVKSGRRLKYK